MMQSPVLDGATKGKSAKVKAAAAKTKVGASGKGSGPKPGDKKKPKGKGKVAPAPVTPPQAPAINMQEAMEKFFSHATKPMSPARIRDAIMSPRGGIRIDFFKLYMNR